MGKGAVGAVRDAALDAVDIVGETAKTAVESARSITSPLIDLDWEPRESAAPTVSRDANDSAAVGRSGADGSADGADGSADTAAAGVAESDAGTNSNATGNAASMEGTYAGILLEGLKQQCKETVQEFRDKGAVGTVKDATLDAVDIVGSAAAAVADKTRTYAAPLLEKAPDAVTSVEGLKQQCKDTVQEFRDKGAVGTVKDATLDAVDIVGNAAAVVAKQTQAYTAPLLEKASTALPDLWAAEPGGGACGAAAGTSGSGKFAPPPRSAGQSLPTDAQASASPAAASKEPSGVSSCMETDPSASATTELIPPKAASSSSPQ